MPRGHRPLREHLVGEEQPTLGVVAIDHLRRVVLQRLEDREFAVSAAEHVEDRFKLCRRAMAAAVRNTALGFKLLRRIDQRDVGPAEDQLQIRA